VCVEHHNHQRFAIKRTMMNEFLVGFPRRVLLLEKMGGSKKKGQKFDRRPAIQSKFKVGTSGCLAAGHVIAALWLAGRPRLRRGEGRDGGIGAYLR
jgi:hypothetical protein